MVKNLKKCIHCRLQFLRIVSLIVILLVNYYTSLGQSDTIQETRNEPLTRILAGCEYGYQPYCFENQYGEADGFSVELLKAAASEMNIEVEFKTGEWADLKKDLANDKLDALPLVGETPERDKIFDFTFPYLSMHGTIVVRKDQTRIHSLADLWEKEVAVLKGDNSEEFLRNSDIKMNIVPRSSFEKALLELSEGKYDAVVVQKLLALQIMKANNLTNLKTVGNPRELFQQSFCFAVKEGEQDLLSLLSEGLSMVIADGTFQMLHKKWFAPLEAFNELPERIVIGGDNNYPPYEFLDENGSPTGYNVELTRAIAQQLDISVNIVLKPWSEIFQDLKDGQIDAVQGMFYTQKRDSLFELSPAHTIVSYVIVGREENKPLPDNISELSDKSILVQKDDIMHERATELGLINQVVPVKSQEMALRLLSEGKHDYALVSKILAYYYTDREELPNIVINEKPVYSLEYCYSVREGNTNLLAKLSEGLAAVKATGQYREIYAKWLGIYEKREFNLFNILRYFLLILIPLIILLIGALIWSYFLKKKVEKRTRELREEINHRKKVQEDLKKSEQKYKSMVETTNEAMAVTRNLDILFHNSAFSELTGYQDDELQSIQMHKLFVDERLNNFLHINSDISTSLSFRKETKIRQKDGNIIDVEIDSALINFEGQEALLLVCRDITERKAIMENLQKKKEQVEKLGDFIPICSSCKKIKDRDQDSQPWVEPEIYISERLEDIKFTHGICPDCLKKLYPGYTPKKENNSDNK